MLNRRLRFQIAMYTSVEHIITMIGKVLFLRIKEHAFNFLCAGTTEIPTKYVYVRT